ncbi:MAG: hypothetical protein FWH33_01080 [Oscillospiraceae bacterium]|nr:hypothetical protein [Oscillospiraceae bacterium]
MKTRSAKAVAMPLAIALAFSLFVAMPMSANAEDANALKATIESFSHGGTGSLATTVSGSTVTVTGSVTGAKNTLSLHIDAGATVLWKAAYSGDIAAGGYMVELTGRGTFDVAAGGAIINGSGNGGGVRTFGMTAIIVSGGTVSASDGNAIYSTDENASITVSGGIVSVEIGNAIHATGSNAAVTVSGGFLFSQGNELFGELGVICMQGGLSPTISNTGIVCAWDRPYGFLPEYDAGTAIELFANPAGKVEWGRKGEESGISYSNGSNTGFFHVNNVLVHASAAPPTPPAPPPKPVTATPTASTVYVNGVAVAFDAYNIGGANYFKLRDLAYALNGTEKQFEVGYDNASKTVTLTSNKAYIPGSADMQPGDGKVKAVSPTPSLILLDGVELNLVVYNIGGANFFMLRDLMKVIDVFVGYDNASKAITLETDKGYDW